MRRKDIDGRYAVGDDGNVYSGGLPLVKRFGCVSLHGESKRVSYLVARAFVPNPDGRPYVTHRNGVIYDDRAENLEWSEEREAGARRGRRPGWRPVQAWDSDWNVVGVWDSPYEAGRALGLNPELIRAAAERQGKTGGYIWQWR